jgi:octopine/nopaline transport system permease protein
MDFAFMGTAFVQLIQGVPLTLNLALVSVLFGAMVAMLVALMRMSGSIVLDTLARAYVFVFRGSPLLVQIFLIYYGLGQFRPVLQEWGLWTLFRDAYWCTIFALTLNTGAYASEIIRGGLQAVPAQQVEAARACGMSGFLLFRRIIFPIAVRQALPAYGSEIILMIKATSLASTVTMMEITGLAAKLNSQTFRTVEVFVVAGVIYLILNFLITRFVMLIEWWLSPHLRRPPVPTVTAETAHV